MSCNVHLMYAEKLAVKQTHLTASLPLTGSSEDSLTDRLGLATSVCVCCVLQYTMKLLHCVHCQPSCNN